jgi:hypothetical protein
VRSKKTGFWHKNPVFRCTPVAGGALLAAALLFAACRTPATPTPKRDDCRAEADCALALRIDACCPCPELASRAWISHTAWFVLYEPGRDYRPLLQDKCAEVACAPCEPPPAELVCRSGECQPAAP